MVMKYKTTRIATNSWGEYLVDLSPREIIKEITTYRKSFCQDLKLNRLLQYRSGK